MIYDSKTWTYTLSTGSQVYACDGVLGIDHLGEVVEGWDGDLFRRDDLDFAAEERREIADYVIAKWQAWAAAENRSVRVFMDLTDFECELGNAPKTSVYATEDDIREHCAGHIDACGFVEVEIQLVRIVQPERVGETHGG